MLCVPHRTGERRPLAGPVVGSRVGFPFLTAEWHNLCLFNYRVAPEKLERRLPRGFSLDEWRGGVFISLVAFQFKRTRVLGVPWPGYISFPEVNLRFYVKAPDGRRGVVFIREYVPQRLVCWAARWLYNEPYAPTPISMNFARQNGVLTVEYTIGRHGAHGRIASRVGEVPTTPPEHSMEHHFKEHQWGFGIDRRGRPLTYEVRHPTWRTRPVESWECRLDWRRLYGDEWAFLGSLEPESIIFAEGSGVKLYPRSGRVALRETSVPPPFK